MQKKNKLVQKNVTSIKPENIQQTQQIKIYYDKQDTMQNKKQMRDSSISLLQSLKSINGLNEHKIKNSKQNQSNRKLDYAYEQTLKKFKSMRGKAKSASHLNLNETTAISYCKTQNKIPNIQSIGKQKIQLLKSRLDQNKIVKNGKNNSVSSIEKNTPKKTLQQKKPKDINNKTKIKFIAERQHTVQDLQENPQQNKINQLQAQFRLTGPNALKNRSQSVPVIQKQHTNNTKLSTKRQTIANKSKQQIVNNKSNKKQMGLINQQKRLQMSKIQFSLTNLKQKISEIKNKDNFSVTSSRLTSFDPKIKKKSNSIFDLSTVPVSLNKYTKLDQLNQSKISKISKKRKQEASEINSLLNFNQQLGFKAQSLTENNQTQINNNSPIHKSQLNRDKKNVENAILNKRSEHLAKLTKKKEHLQQIVEDIENENIQKEQKLKQHKNSLKNIQINLLTKRQRINQLQFEINNYRQSEDQQIPQKQQKDSNDAKMKSEGNQKKEEVNKLKNQKIQKQKKYSLEKDILKSEIRQIQNQMREQQNKFKLLKDEEQHIKNKEFELKQIQLQNKNKQITAQLQRKTAQLQLIIQKQKEKAKKYQQQLSQQRRKNQQITNQLKKQQQMEQLLLKQLEKISKDRLAKKAKKQERKNQQKLRLIQQIKQLEETQNKILMEYQRDTQNISSMYEAMRLKNIELENKIKQKRKIKQNQQKQKQKQKKSQMQNVVKEHQSQSILTK